MELRQINPENYAAALEMSVRADQRHLVAEVSKSLADAFVYQGSIFRLACAQDEPVGYVLLYPYHDNDRHLVNIVRFMIDQHHQGRGYGNALLAEVLEFIGTLQPSVDAVRVSTLPENQAALNLYTRSGFVESGREENEIALYLQLK